MGRGETGVGQERQVTLHRHTARVGLGVGRGIGQQVGIDQVAAGRELGRGQAQQARDRIRIAHVVERLERRKGVNRLR